MQLQLIPHQVGTNLINQRVADGYVNATAMCQAVGKRFFDYRRLPVTDAFLDELTRSAGIPADLLIFTTLTGRNEERGTWVHPHVAVNLGQWCSPKFAVAVSQWVHDWMSGAGQSKARLPYHLRRYVANRSAVPAGHFSILNEMIIALIAPMEEDGYTLPERMLPDISEGKMFCRWLREEKGIDTKTLPKYTHRFEDGRSCEPNAYPNRVLADFREHFTKTWLPKHAEKYFAERDPAALQYLPKLLPPPDPKQQELDVNTSKIEQIKTAIFNTEDKMKAKPRVPLLPKLPTVLLGKAKG